MSSLASTKDDNIAVEAWTTVTEQGNSENKPSEQGNSEAKTQETTIVTQEATKEGETAENDSKDSPGLHSSESQNLEMKDIPTTSTSSASSATEDVDSQRPSGSSNVKSLKRKTSSTGRILLKRNSSRLNTPKISGIRLVAEEVDSAPPRSSKRRSHKKQMVALFLESDYPRKK